MIPYRPPGAFVISVQLSSSEGEWQIGHLRALARFALPIPVWRGWVACAAFDLEPSAEALAHAIEEVAANSPLSEWSLIASGVSWPLQACLRGAEHPDELRVVADALRRGELGDVKDWRDAES